MHKLIIEDLKFKGNIYELFFSTLSPYFKSIVISSIY